MALKNIAFGIRANTRFIRSRKLKLVAQQRKHACKRYVIPDIFSILLKGKVTVCMNFIFIASTTLSQFSDF